MITTFSSYMGLKKSLAELALQKAKVRATQIISHHTQGNEF